MAISNSPVESFLETQEAPVTIHPKDKDDEKDLAPKSSEDTIQFCNSVASLKAISIRSRQSFLLALRTREMVLPRQS
jgi:hypothetical protein